MKKMLIFPVTNSFNRSVTRRTIMNIKCEHCGQKYEVDESNAGQNAECGACFKKFIIAPTVEPELEINQTETGEVSEQTVADTPDSSSN
jgi:hypothetical protein